MTKTNRQLQRESLEYSSFGRGTGLCSSARGSREGFSEGGPSRRSIHGPNPNCKPQVKTSRTLASILRRHKLAVLSRCACATRFMRVFPWKSPLEH